MDRTRLKDVPFFSSMSRRELTLLGQQTDEIDVAAGKVLIREGEFGQEFFVIESGTADVSQDGEVIARLGPGDFFGEMALVRDDRRTATVTATSPMELVVMTRASFRALDSSSPKVHAEVSRAIEDRHAARH